MFWNSRQIPSDKRLSRSLGRRFRLRETEPQIQPYYRAQQNEETRRDTRKLRNRLRMIVDSREDPRRLHARRNEQCGAISLHRTSRNRRNSFLCLRCSSSGNPAHRPPRISFPRPANANIFRFTPNFRDFDTRVLRGLSFESETIYRGLYWAPNGPLFFQRPMNSGIHFNPPM